MEVRNKDMEHAGGAGRENKRGGSDREVRLKIGEVSRRSRISIESLRFYERQGLLGRPARTESGYRIYNLGVLDRLAFIKKAQFLGFSLTEIRQIIAEKESGHNPCRHVREVVRSRLQELDQRMKEMQRYRNELAVALAEWDESQELDGHVCGLIESTEVPASVDTSAAMGRVNRERGK